jgi:hypothetical protein
MGAGIYQTALVWASVAPTRPRHPRNPRDPAYHWPSDVDYAIGQASVYHMRVLLQVGWSPPWTNGGRPGQFIPAHTGDLADFLTAAAHRYASVHLWMVWGEATNPNNFSPMATVPPTATKLTVAQAWAPHHYAQMLDASYAALKHVSSRNLVIGGNTYTTGNISTSQWITNLRLPNGKPPRLDLYGHNPFSWLRAPDLSNPPSPDGEVDFSDLGRLEALVNDNLAPRHHHIPLFLSEWTIPTGANDPEFNFWATLPVQAQWITDAWRIVRHYSFIYALGWIHVYDDPPGGGSTGGLFDYHGNPKPGYYAWKAG